MEYLDENYNLVHHKTDIEVPEGAEMLVYFKEYDNANFYKSGFSEIWQNGRWGDDMSDCIEYCKKEGVVLWQRTHSVDKSQWDIQVGGDHYKSMKIQPAKFALENKLDYCQANAIKYICRYESKNGKQDLEKAKHYIDLLIEHYYG